MIISSLNDDDDDDDDDKRINMKCQNISEDAQQITKWQSTAFLTSRKHAYIILTP